jgi:hypothetical protein
MAPVVGLPLRRLCGERSAVAGMRFRAGHSHRLGPRRRKGIAGAGRRASRLERPGARLLDCRSGGSAMCAPRFGRTRCRVMRSRAFVKVLAHLPTSLFPTATSAERGGHAPHHAKCATISLAKNARAAAPPETRATNSHGRVPIPARLPLPFWIKVRAAVCLDSH